MESISIQSNVLKILRDTRKKYYGIHRNGKEDPTIFYGILDKNAISSISIANKILLDPIRFYGILHKNAVESMQIAKKILEDPARFYGILDKNAMESISIANTILQDSKGY